MSVYPPQPGTLNADLRRALDTRYSHNPGYPPHAVADAVADTLTRYGVDVSWDRIAGWAEGLMYGAHRMTNAELAEGIAHIASRRMTP